MKNTALKACLANNKLLVIYLVLISSILIGGCSSPSNKESKNNMSVSSLTLHAGDERYIAVDTKKSTIVWKGYSVAGSNSHTGYVYLSKGELLVEGGQLTGGTMEVDMNTIEDKDHRSDNNLINHLKNADFFEVEKFPFSAMVITRVVSDSSSHYTISGNLTVKGITHPVTFPARIAINNKTLIATGKLVIDRTKWNILYKSLTFYKNLANQALSDAIELDIHVVAKR
jgi:polyisoprenoid-binding protein YceI